MKFGSNHKTSGHFSIKKSIRLRFTLITMFLLLASTMITVLMNVYFLERYYRNNKKTVAIEEIAEVNEIMSRYNFSGKSEDTEESMTLEIDQVLEECWTKYSMSFFILSADDLSLFSSSIRADDLQFRLRQYVFDQNMDMDILYNNSKYQIVLMRGKRGTDSYLDAFGYLDNGCSFLLSMPVESIKESVSLSNRFYVITGFIVAMMTGILVFLMMRRLTKPIQELSQLAVRMSQQDFNVFYEGKAQDEIGQLGSSMNEMSKELEKTIQELKSANEQLTKDIEEKIQIDEMRKEFLSNVSHELKTPIAIIQGYAEGLQDCVNEDEESRMFYTDVIMDEAAKMNQMVQKLLKLNQLEFGNSVLDVHDFDLDLLIQDMMNATQVLLADTGATMEYENHASKNLVSGDEFMIEEVLKNYTSNAIHHVAKGGRILITAEDSGADHIRVRVYNQGQQLPEETLDQVWVKFYKVDKARTREYGGSGIGLSIVKAIMDQHGCSYGVQNREDGVEFWFELSYAKEDADGSDFE